MSQETEQTQPETNMEQLKQEASASEAGGAGNAAGAASPAKRIIVQIVVAIAVILVVRAYLKSRETTQSTTAACRAGTEAQRAAVNDVQGPVAVSADDPAVCGVLIQALDDLNRKALDSDGVFVFLAGKDVDKARDVIAILEKTAVKMRDNGMKLGLFTLSNTSSEFDDLAAQASTPGVIALVKGQGVKVVRGEIDEASLTEALVAASSAGGGCGAEGCGACAASGGCSAEGGSCE